MTDSQRTETKILDRGAILSRPVEIEAFAMPEWNGVVHLRRLTFGDTLALAAAPNQDYAAKLIVASVVDAAGAPLFEDADIPALKTLPAREIDRLVKRISALNGMGAEAAAAIEGNSSAGDGRS